ncbi:MAG: monovalent cation/H(+) antiporter subunit G [Candidatus Thiodiazotropha sp. (ex Ctena orbiculata)]|uniref:Monovalent cation/H(+) antiporter subunit G n=1 Tax=Candidatus Thiodiazotropha taylori TaxID=2792791 RepID=A0A944QSJ5_9GAMM|nr:monovalent cation/H(+) antiporter subunit G [Candidatus Thiodiazotropha taylori]PUB88323.1 MAG: Na+/H+ antiporter subunit G [gamma proteobacterium symbiont of Ctena orbiculata]MBT2988097.1 monovalent cation/H(+) antiporter subunit G [Candidatus Thiodiazotropha taylori]MBT2998860.1 monovalent cation/H(+) antiporter subunit G [Candidatus Thiodiazotropha taylori]MBT3002161.1 monovalent cation/H(+) antiporter subunit G [Candidatus Thiodiazotropha taylori]
MRLLADLILLIGAAFTLLGALGLVRMPDVYNRIQAGTKAVTLGALSLLLGIGLLYPQWWSKLLIIALMILVTNPIGSSTIARALLTAGVKPWKKTEQATSVEERQ